MKRPSVTLSGVMAALAVASLAVVVQAAPAQAAVTVCDTYTQRGVGGGYVVHLPAPGDCSLWYRQSSTITGTGVIVLQRTLNNCYAAGLTVDGRFGPATAAAVAKAQRLAGVSADGQYGPITRDAIHHAAYGSTAIECVDL